MVDQIKLIQEIIDERTRQDAKWGEQNHNPDFWLAILMEEVGEMSKAFLEKNMSDYRKELVQVCAVSLSMLESYDRNTSKLIPATIPISEQEDAMTISGEIIASMFEDISVEEGPYLCYGIVNDSVERVDCFEDIVKANVTYLRLNDRIYMFEEDPDDGYRSFMLDVKSKSILGMSGYALSQFNFNDYPFVVDVRKIKVDEDEEYPFEGIRLYKPGTFDILGEFGTYSYGDYYPYSASVLDIESINAIINAKK